MPSFTFVSTANAVVLRGAAGFRRHPARHPEHRRDKIEAAITERTRRSCRSTTRESPARWTRIDGPGRHNDLLVIEDAAQGVNSPSTRARARVDRRPGVRTRSTKRRTTSRARAGRCASIGPNSPNGPRSSATRGPIARSSSGARSTSTRGSTSAPRTSPARSWGPFLYGQLEMMGADPRPPPRD